jgi:outer membrane protein TolC
MLAFVVGISLVTSTAHADPPALTLSEAIRIAHAASPDLTVAQLRVEQLEMEESVARTGYYPQLNGSLTAIASGVKDTLPPVRQVPFTYYLAQGEARATLHWTLADFGKTASAVNQAISRTEAERLSALASKADVARATATLFFQVLFDEQLVESRKVSLKNRSRFAAFAKALVERGVKAGLDDVRARLNVEVAKHELLRVESRVKSDRVRLAALLGMDSGKVGPLVKPNLPALEGEDPARSSALAVKNRPEIQALAAETTARERHLEGSKAAYWPNLSLQVSGAYGQKQFDFLPAPVPKSEGAVFLTLSFPILEPHIWRTIRVSEASIAVSRAREAKVRRDVTTEAQTAVIELQSARALVARAKELSTSAEGALTVTEARYQAGLSTPLELVDAESTDIDAREAVASAELKVEMATLELLVATSRWTVLQGK